MKKLLIFILFSTQLLATTIGIYTYYVPGVTPWDSKSVERGIAGSEEAVIYLGAELAKLGYRVYVFANPPTDSLDRHPKANPRYLPLDEAAKIPVDHALSWRNPYNAESLKKLAHYVHFWPHDTPPYAPVAAEQVKAFDSALWLSKWQRNEWIKKESSFENFPLIFGNGIHPKQFSKISPRENPYSCIYASNYARGLGHLLAIWPEVRKEFPTATLDIYYGWSHWGLLTPEQELQLKTQIAQLADYGVKERGCVGHKELAEANARASLWTYPCTAPETFCITALKAQYSGAIPVIIEGSALPETVQYGYRCNSTEEYLKILLTALKEAPRKTLSERKEMRGFIKKRYTWEALATQLKEHLDRFVLPASAQ